MTQEEFRTAMNWAKRDGGLLWVTNGTISGIALGYDSGTNEALLHKNVRVPLAGLRALDTLDRLSPNLEGEK